MNNHIDLPGMVIYGCMAGAALFAVFGWQRARSREQKLRSINQQLERELGERRRIEADLRVNNDQIFALFNRSPLRVFLLDSQLRVRLINAKARTAFGNVEEPIGRDISELMASLLPPPLAAQILAHFRHTLETGEPYSESGLFNHHAEREKREFYDWEVHRVAMGAGQYGLACYFADVSAHILAKLALQQSENRKSAIFNTSLDAIITMDHEGRIMDFNPAAEKIFGYLRSDVLGKPLADLIIPERLRQRHYEGLSRYLASGEGPVLNKRIEMPALHADGHEFPVELSISRIAETDPPAFTGTLRDISERKQAEEALRKAQEESQHRADNLEVTVEKRTADLREKIGELEAFSYSISHDLRAPLRAIQGYATVMLDVYRSDLDKKGLDYLERMQKAATRMDLLIQDVLTYSKVTRQEMTLEPINLEKLIAEICQEYEAFQAPKAIITVNQPLPHVLGHEAFLTQIISNLLGNAVKFVKPGVTPHILIRAESEGELVWIWFEDNGIGIEATHFARIFSIFGRIYDDKMFEGTGIGLAIVKKAVERMDGQIGVESTPGVGSRFWFTLKKA